jgi:ankyrin repeat protein
MLYIDESFIKEPDASDAEAFVAAASQGDIARVRRMLDNGMHPDTQGPNGWTALRRAAVKNNVEVALELLQRGARVDAINYTGKTALMMACAHGNPEMASLLLFYGADPDITDGSGKTALMFAARFGYALVAGTLLDATVRPELEKADRSGRSARQYAVESGHNNIARMLEAAGSKRNAAALLQSSARPAPDGLLTRGAV